MFKPSSTYRIQFNHQFTFKNLVEHLSYLTSLGIGAVYASPVFGAVPGSNHGYDVTDPQAFSNEIGNEEDFGNISHFLRLKGVGWIQDIVPNHMAFHPDNKWLTDILEKGKQSAYAGYFDIDWDHPHFKDKLMVPILGNTLEACVDKKEIQLTWENGGLFINYYNFKMPASGESFHALLEEYKTLEDSYFVGQSIANEEFKANPAFQGFGWSNSRQRFQAIYETDSAFETLIDNICDEVNSNSSKLMELLTQQHFVLTHWQEVEKHLNYRRFFTINGLISLAMEKQKVFDDYHSFILDKVKSGQFQGLRIDHIDGLLCPGLYFDRLRANTGEETFIIAEKILERHEVLLKDWPIQGSSGYDFLAMVNNIFTNHSAIHQLTGFYKELSGTKYDTEDIIYQKKKLILKQSFQADWDNLFRKIEESGLIKNTDKITREELREALGEFLINCPVYKLYSYRFPLDQEDVAAIRKITDESLRRTPHLIAPLNKIQQILTGENLENPEEADYAMKIFLRCMQYTGPLMAKGVEDTAMYTWAAFLAHNEVGDAVDAEGLSGEEFHKRMEERRNNYPLSLNATATHDTKRGEDSRARLNVISDYAPEWMNLVKEWSTLNQPFKTLINGSPVPDFNEEYFIYQTLTGVLPMDGHPDNSIPERVNNYLRKSLREAKLHSDWNKPDEIYENAVISFVENITGNNSPFLKSLQAFSEKLIPWGIINSLSQVVLKCTCPGIPDFYQGTELWDLSLVDPDNRRAVDYTTRQNILTELTWHEENKQPFFTDLLKNKSNGKIKLWLSHKLMMERNLHPDVFHSGEYIPLQTKGEFREHILAFARRKGISWYVTIIPLHLAALPGNNLAAGWGDTAVELPANSPRKWNLIWDNSPLNSGREIPVSKVLPTNCPAVLKGEMKETGRGSGILLHITSLPGKFGSGSLGEEAYRFVDSLNKAKQSYWQILPFNPVGGTYSPYSSSSAFAGNTNWIDPDMLEKTRLIKKFHEPAVESNTADFSQNFNLKELSVNEAFENYTKTPSILLQKRFEDFCQQENEWLDDFALYSVLKKEFENKSWNNWPEPFKTRDKGILKVYRKKYTSELTRIKFAQYLFSHQFKKLKSYANSKGIKLIGDMPIYISYDSADVWSNPSLFNLKPDLTMKTVAGVPPDYFSKTGQLWNMPVYNWSAMENNRYHWWKKRISKNLEYCDLLRFDHFRGFSSYWEVPAGETTAINGKWAKGPSHHFFTELKNKFPDMPFIAEDLGEIDDDVYRLRDVYSLPGMNVLQFAFGDNMPGSVHILHNHRVNSIVYTGTHDNNTIKGWYKNELGKINQKQVAEYLNKKVKTKNINEDFIRLAYSSVARVAIIPIQDILNLGETARFNTPSEPEGNWIWKLKNGDLTENHLLTLRKLTEMYGRKT